MPVKVVKYIKMLKKFTKVCLQKLDINNALVRLRGHQIWGPVNLVCKGDTKRLNGFLVSPVTHPQPLITKGIFQPKRVGLFTEEFNLPNFVHFVDEKGSHRILGY